MTCPTLRATVHNGKIQLLDEIQLPEDALIIVTIMEGINPKGFSGLQKITG